MSSFMGSGWAKVWEQLTEMREEVLYKVFLDLRKAYNAIDW